MQQCCASHETCTADGVCEWKNPYVGGGPVPYDPDKDTMPMACYNAKGHYYQCMYEDEFCCPNDSTSIGTGGTGDQTCCKSTEVCSGPGVCTPAGGGNTPFPVG